MVQGFAVSTKIHLERGFRKTNQLWHIVILFVSIAIYLVHIIYYSLQIVTVFVHAILYFVHIVQGKEQTQSIVIQLWLFRYLGVPLLGNFKRSDVHALILQICISIFVFGLIYYSIYYIKYGNSDHFHPQKTIDVQLIKLFRQNFLHISLQLSHYGLAIFWNLNQIDPAKKRRKD